MIACSCTAQIVDSVARFRVDDRIQSVDNVLWTCSSFSSLMNWPCRCLLVNSSSRFRILMELISCFRDTFDFAAMVSISSPRRLANFRAF